MGIGEAGNFLSYGFAPASVVAPLGTVALIANGVFAPLVLGESFTRRNVLGVALAIVGAVTIVWSSRDDNKRVSGESKEHGSAHADGYGRY
jgi:drug/metabolite transporter (DMT)-like permease